MITQRLELIPVAASGSRGAAQLLEQIQQDATNNEDISRMRGIYYGPYSKEVHEAADILEEAGLIEEYRCIRTLSRI